MTYSQMRWIAAFLVGAANLLVAPYTDGAACWLAAGVCGLACIITFKSTWGNE